MNDANGVELQKGDKVILYNDIMYAGVITSITFYGVIVEVKDSGFITSYGRKSNQVVKVWDNTKYEKLCAAILQYQVDTEDEDLLDRILSYIED